MATYLYETTDSAQPIRQFELQQSMKEDALTHHPETGEPIRRVITGGYGYLSARGNAPTHSDMRPSSSGGSCGSGCGCH